MMTMRTSEAVEELVTLLAYDDEIILVDIRKICILEGFFFL
jgi:hypothetical protein